MEIFQNDAAKVDKLNEMLCQKAGFTGCYDISTQTYTRKVDLRVANALSALGATATRIATVSKGTRLWTAVEPLPLIDLGYPPSLP